MKDHKEKNLEGLKNQEVDTENVKGGLSREQDPMQKVDRKFKPAEFNKPSPFGRGSSESSK